MKLRWVLSCEHGGNRVPQEWSSLFEGADELLQSHRGWDPGALSLFQKLEPLADFSLSSTTTRLLVELNRSLHHPNLFSRFSKSLDKKTKERILEQHYHPYRSRLEKTIGGYLKETQKVYHLSIHSFTPKLNDKVRNADIGLLYDPARGQEKQACLLWKKILEQHLPHFRVRMNYPYQGRADGFTTHLRKCYRQAYAGIEFELNQKWADQEEVYEKLYVSLQELKSRIS